MVSVVVLDLLMLHLRPPNTFFFFFNDTATTEIYTLSLHDALPISQFEHAIAVLLGQPASAFSLPVLPLSAPPRSEEHTSELQSRLHLVCRLLLEKKKQRLSLTPVERLPAVRSSPTTPARLR